MALPQLLKSARMTNDTVGTNIDNEVGNIEKALCDILGFTVDVNITESPFGCDNSGRLTKALLRQIAAGPVGNRFRDSTAGKEFRLVLDGTDIKVDENTGTEGSPTWTNRAAMALATGVWTLTGIPVGPASDPTTDNQLTRKAFVDAGLALKAVIAGDQTLTGIKTFSSIPVLPASDPTTDNQAARRKWVADYVAAAIAAVQFNVPYALIVDQKASGTSGGTFTSGDWRTRDLNTEIKDADNIVTISNNQFTLAAGTYRIRTMAPTWYVDGHKTKLYNTSDGADVSGCVSTSLYTANCASVSILNGEFTIAAQKTFEIRHRCTSSQSSDGFGNANSFSGYPEIFLQVELWKVG